MIYKIANKYYVNISPMIFSEVELVVKGDEVVIKPAGKKIEVNNKTIINQVDLSEEKKKILENSNNGEPETKEYRPNKYNRRK